VTCQQVDKLVPLKDAALEDKPEDFAYDAIDQLYDTADLINDELQVCVRARALCGGVSVGVCL
jgi:hypothetical protein